MTKLGSYRYSKICQADSNGCQSLARIKPLRAGRSGWKGLRVGKSHWKKLDAKFINTVITAVGY
jgi:hypothetical protein